MNRSAAWIFLPTMCAVAGLQQPNDRVIDGANWLPVLQGGKVERKTPLYWHFNRAAGEPKGRDAHR
jgi:hypothetical protein